MPKKSLFVGFVAFLSVFVFQFAPNGANAAVDSVDILETIFSRCGNQKTYVSGTSTFALVSNRDLVIKLDGREVYVDKTHPTTWVTTLFDITPEWHDITATIYGDGAHTRAVATDSIVVNVPSCPSSGGGSNNGGGGKEEPKIPEKVNAVIVKIPVTFKSVFGRKINAAENKYWTNRAIGRGEKYTIKDVKKEMLAHKLAGRTMPQSLVITKKGAKLVTVGKGSVAVDTFKVLAKEKSVKKGGTVTLQWVATKDNRMKFKNERVYLCDTKEKCVAIVAMTPNDGSEKVVVNAKPGAYRIALQALNEEGNPMPGIRMNSSAFKILAN